MALIKKTAVLTDGGAVGYVTVVRVGDEVGAKIVGESFAKGMLAGLKVGGADTVYTKLAGDRTELNFNADFKQTDDISCVILQGDKQVAKTGGKVSVKDVDGYFNAQTAAAQSAKESKEPSKTARTKASDEQATPPNAAFDDAKEPERVAPPKAKPQQQTQKKTSAARAQGHTTAYAPKDGTLYAEEEDAPARTAAPKTSYSGESEKEFLSKLQNPGNKNFYINIKERLDELFVIHPREENLEKVIPESQWVRVRYDGDDYYVVGKLSDGGVVAYLAYGVPGVAEVPPPKIAAEISDWLPMENLSEPYKGYWLIFQDASNGKVGSIK